MKKAFEKRGSDAMNAGSMGRGRTGICLWGGVLLLSRCRCRWRIFAQTVFGGGGIDSETGHHIELRFLYWPS
jgi:hypothetical protein